MSSTIVTTTSTTLTPKKFFRNSSRKMTSTSQCTKMPTICLKTYLLQLNNDQKFAIQRGLIWEFHHNVSDGTRNLKGEE